MATRHWPPRVIRQDGAGPPPHGSGDPAATNSSATAASAGATDGGAGPSLGTAATMVGAPAVRIDGQRVSSASAAVPSPISNGRTTRSTTEIRDGAAATTSLVRQARGVLVPVRDHGQTNRGTTDGEAPAFETRALTLTDKQGEIFFVKHTIAPPYDGRLSLLRNRDSERAASYRLLRQRLVERGDPKVIMVTSARRNEGKTTSAANLALALAEQGHARVLLVEANFRAPSLGELFGFKPPRCFSVQLDRHRDRPMDPWVVVQVAPTDLHVVAVHPNCCPSCARVLVPGASFCGDCGRRVTTETLRLDRATFAASIQRFRKAFDYVVIDGPSALESADVNLIQDTANGIIMVARSQHSDARSLKRAMDQVSPAPVLGVALVED
ncbi:MAG TPA: hypothetical protein VMU50_20995 [Polyangia bacterium]|nr:hypothetical protein [Polyangia bacterium]